MSHALRVSKSRKIRVYTEYQTAHYNSRIARDAKIDTVGHSIWNSILTAPARPRRPTPPVPIDEDDKGAEAPSRN